MLNRTNPPEIIAIDEISLEQPEQLSFKNGLKVFLFHAPDQELIKAEFVFSNLFDNPENPVRNTALNAMLKEGTSKLNSEQIAEKIDYYGAYLIPEYSFDHNSLTLYCLNKHTETVLPLVHDVLTDAIFPQQELDTYIRNNKQSLQISLEKTDYLARRLFYKSLFGSSRYGISLSEDLLSGLERADLFNLYKQQIQPKNATLFLSGNLTPAILALFKRLFDDEWTAGVDVSVSAFNKESSKLPNFQLIEKADALQSSIRLGKTGIQRNHPDYPALQFVNTMFGGYFGSRLMSNIREEKGYTYSIGSVIANLSNTGFLSISTDVGSNYTKDTLKEIEFEMNKLKQELASGEEIQLVKNYILGSMLGSLESIFSHVDKFKSVYYSNLDLSYYQYYTEVIKSMDALKIQEIAQKYLNYEDMVKVVVGKYE